MQISSSTFWIFYPADEPTQKLATFGTLPLRVGVLLLLNLVKGSKVQDYPDGQSQPERGEKGKKKTKYDGQRPVDTGSSWLGLRPWLHTAMMPLPIDLYGLADTGHAT